MKKDTVNFLNKLNESVKPVKKECSKPTTKKNKKPLKEGEDGWYEVTIGFAGFIGAENDYSIQADSKEDAVNDALEEAQMDLEVIAVDGEEYIYESEKSAKTKNKKKLKEESYNDDIYRRIEEALQNAGFEVDRYSDVGVLTKNLGWTIYDSSGKVDLTCAGTWLDDDDLEECDKSSLNEKINKDNIEINRAIANPNLGKNRDKIKAAGYETKEYDDGKVYSIKNTKTGKSVSPEIYNKDEKKKIDFKGKLDSERPYKGKVSVHSNYAGKGKSIPSRAVVGKNDKNSVSVDADEYDAYSRHQSISADKPNYRSISKNINDYKDAVKNRDEKTRWAKSDKEGLKYYEDKVKKAQEDLNREKKFINKYEKEAKDSEKKRKEILSRARAKKNESEEMLKESLVPVSELPDFCYGVLPSDCSIIIIKKGENGYYLTNKGYEREYADIEDWNEKNNKADEVCNRLNAQIDVTPEQRQSMEVRSMFGNWND